jgi:wyosine [tRNA(Phe)-imidazoG37] synthetase (radical SAM superfamily)
LWYNKRMKYIYGPVQSRRLGLSLGVSLTPYKVCNFDCIYCQLGRTSEPAGERKEYIPIEDILNELRVWLQNNTQEAKVLDYITLSGSGEPTLNTGIGELISRIKEITSARVAVITNASLLNIREVRQALLGADLLVPSLDAVLPEIFRRLNRPHPKINLDEVIEGLLALRKEFPGKIWLEIMIVRGVNDDLAHIRKLKEIIERMNPDKIQINGPVRTTVEQEVFAADKRKLNKIKEILGEKCEII